MTSPLQVLALISAVGCALAAGVFFAFSTFVMPALGRLEPAAGVTAMQAINVAAVRPGLMLELFGTAAACVATSGAALADWRSGTGPFVVLGTVFYLVGAIGITAAFHQPRNLALAALEAAASNTADRWTKYLTEWSAANHVRTIAPLVATVAFLIGAFHV